MTLQQIGNDYKKRSADRENKAVRLIIQST